MIYQLESHVAKKLKDFFNSFDFIDKVVVFGSRARHDCNPKSDIDLCIYSLEMSDKQFSKLKFEIDELPILYKLDIVHFEKVNEELRANIERDEKLLFVKKELIKNIGKVITGKTPKTNIDEYWNSNDIPFIKPTDFKTNISALSSYINYISFEGSKKANLIPKNSVLVTCIGTIGKVTSNNIESTTNQQINSIVPNSRIDYKYLMYQMLKKKSYLQHIANAPVVPIINKTTFENVEIILPTLTKQKKIAQTLDKAQELITLRKESIEKLDDLAKSLFIDMFGDPVSNPMKWRVVTLNHYGSLARGKSSHRPRNAIELYNGKFPFIQTGDLSNGNNIYLKNYKQTYSELGIKQSKLFPINTIGIAIAANIGNAKILKREFYFPDSVVGFITDCPEFSLFLLQFYKKKLDERATKTAQKNINLKILNELEVIEVPITLQNKFAKTIEKIEEQKVLYEEELKKLQESFDSLLQRSFS